MDNFKDVGYMGKDPEMKWSQDGKTAITSFTVAVKRPKWNQNDKEFTDWHKCKAFGKKAEFIANNFKKGDCVMVSGRVELNEWTDKEGVKKYFTEINASDIQWVGKKGDGAARNDAPHPAERDDSGPRQPAQAQQQQSAPPPPSRPVAPAAPAPVQSAYPGVDDTDYDPDDPFKLD
jgi:single-strand DNA-binding protein